MRCSTTSPIRWRCTTPVGRDFVIMAVMGGMRSFWGPLVGAAIFVVLQDYISSMTRTGCRSSACCSCWWCCSSRAGLLGMLQRRATHEHAEVRATSPSVRQPGRGQRRFAQRRAGRTARIIGPNGAGKTTFFNLISGFFPPTSGRSCSTARTSPLPRTQRVKLGMARTFQITEIFPELTVHENVRIAVEVAAGYRLHRGSRATRRERAPRRRDPALGADGEGRPLVGELSHGDQRAAEIAMALALKPRCCCSTSRPRAWASRRPTRSPAADPPAAQEQQLHDRADRARHARGVQPRRPHHGARPRAAMLADGTPQEIAANERCRPPIWARPHERARGRGPEHLLRQEPHPARRRPRRRRGPITALLGRNGAGKTTTLRSLMGLTPARKGRVTMFGQDTTRWPPYRIAALGVGYVPEGRRISPT
jgi:branched-chain amino acid transport system ATP-binding protein